MGKLIQRTGLLWVMLFCACYSSSRSETVTTEETTTVGGKVKMESDFGDYNSTLQRFDVGGNQELYFDEFAELCKNLFVDAEHNTYKLDNETLQELFTIFDRDGNGFICKKEFPVCYNEWIKKIVNPVSVLVVVDVQNDFIDGSLALKNAPAGQDGKEVIEPINKLQESIHFKQVIYTKDWHPDNHISFFDNVELRPLDESSKIKNVKDVKLFDTVVFKGDSGQLVEQKLWPRHAVQNSTGAELHPDLKIVPGSKEAVKGTQPDMDSYSAFMDNDKKSLTKLKELVDEVGAQDVYVCGLAFDICAGATAMDSLTLGYRTVLVEDATRGLDVNGIEEMRMKLVKANGVIAMTDQVKAMVEGMDRRPELGIHWARVLKNKWEEKEASS